MACVATLTTLFRQIDLTFHPEMTRYAWRSGIRLAAADADGVIAAGDRRLTVFVDYAEVAVL